MPLYELEEGTSGTFFHIELLGTTVHINWGLKGTDGQHRVIPHESVTAARAEYQRQIDRRIRSGYRRVLADQSSRLAKTSKLTPSPRFLFVHRVHKRFAWVEARDAILVHAEGPASAEATTDPTSKTCATPAAAIAERDAIVATLIEQGFELETFGAAPEPETRKLQTNEALEAAVADDPYDDGAWSVLEDWLLEQNDPRGDLVRYARSPRVEQDRARARLLPQLLGAKHERFERALEAHWRGGYILECDYQAQITRGFWTTQLYRRPAARLIRDITFHFSQLEGAAGLDGQLEAIANAPCKQSLRAITIHRTSDTKPVAIDAARFAALPKLASVALHTPYVELSGAAKLSIRELSIACGRARAAESWTANAPLLERLSIAVVDRVTAEAIFAVFRGRGPQQLRELAIWQGSEPSQRIAIRGFENVALTLPAYLATER